MQRARDKECKKAEEGGGTEESNRAPAIWALRGGNGRKLRQLNGLGIEAGEFWGVIPDIEHSTLSNTALPADGDRCGHRAPSSVCSTALIAPIHCV